jgi:hypothetical protein
MRYALGALVFLSATGLVLACNDDNRAPEPTGPGEMLPPVIGDAPTCAATAAHADVQAPLYFQTDVLRLAEAEVNIDLIAAQCALLAQGQAAPDAQSTIDRLGFQVLLLVDDSREARAPQQGWDANSTVLVAGSELTNDILAFMNVGVGNGRPGIDFTRALMTAGIYEVRGRSDETAARTLPGLAPFTWGAEPTGSGGWNWRRDGTADASVLIYGEPKATPTAGTEAPIDREDGEPAGEAAYTIKSIPNRTFDGGNEVRVGTCETGDAGAVLQSSDHLSNRVLEYGGVPGFCQAQASVTGLGSRLLRFAADLFAPPLQAATLATTGGTSGTKGSFSDWFLVTLGVPTATAKGQGNTRVGARLTIEVKLVGEENFPVEGAVVTLTIHTNKGVSATFCSIPCGDGVGDNQTSIEATTNEFGVAVFDNYGVSKPGGYKVTASFKYPPPPDEEYSATVVSSVFNVKQ